MTEVNSRRSKKIKRASKQKSFQHFSVSVCVCVYPCVCADFKAKGTKRPAIAAGNRERVGKAGNSAKRPQQTKNNDLCIRLCVCLLMFLRASVCAKGLGVCVRARK